MDKLTAKLKSLNAVSAQDIELLTSLFKDMELKKGWVLNNPAWKTKRLLYFISSGLVKGTITYHEDFLTLWIMESGFLISGETIESIKDTKAFSLNLRKVAKLTKDNPELYKVLLEIYEDCLIEGKKRELMLRIKNAKKRYAYFKENYPELSEILTTDQTADFINIDRKYFYSILK